jgi:hypothetical protein
MAGNNRKFNRIRPADVSAVPARPPVLAVVATTFAGERRRIVTARPDGEIFWHDGARKPVQTQNHFPD